MARPLKEGGIGVGGGCLGGGGEVGVDTAPAVPGIEVLYGDDADGFCVEGEGYDGDVEVEEFAVGSGDKCILYFDDSGEVGVEDVDDVGLAIAGAVAVFEFEPGGVDGGRESFG